jgi:hypothetical protein
MKKITIEKKKDLLKAARIAKQPPIENQVFWEAVRGRMDVRQKNMVKPR